MRHLHVMKLILLAILMVPNTYAQSAKQAESMLHAGDVDGALGLAKAAIGANPSDRVSHALLIDILMHRGLGATAQSLYSAFVEDNPDSAMAWTLLGRASTRIDTATEAYQKALGINPHYAPAWVGMGDIYRATGELTNSKVAYEKALELDSQEATAYTGLGALYLQHGKRPEALRTAQTAMTQVPSDSEAYLAAAQLQPEQALGILERGSRQASQDPRIHSGLGRMYLEAGRLGEAKASFQKTLTIHPHHPEASRYMAVVDAIEREHLDLDGWEQMERSTLLIQETPEASVDLNAQLRKRFPNCALIRLLSAQPLVALNRLDEAQVQLEEGLALNSEDVDLNATLGLLLQARDQHDSALPLLEKAALARPSDPSLQLAYGISTANVRGPRMAAQILATAAERFPSDARPAMALSTLLAKNGDPESAYTVLERAVAQYASPDLLLALAGAAKDVGRTAEAASALRRLSELTGDPSWNRAAEGLSED